MKHHILVFTCLCSAAVVFVSAIPLPANDRELDVLQIPLDNGKEIDVLTLGTKEQEQLIAERNKRTVGLLRELFPDITKQIDGIVNRIIAQVIRVAGPSLLPALLGNNNNRGTTEKSSFDADFDDDDDDDTVTDVKSNSVSTNNDDATSVKIDLPTFIPDDDDDTNGNEITTTAKISTSKQIDEQVNMIVAKVLRAFGPTLLRTAIQGNTANQARSSFDADFDDDDDNSSSSSSSDVSSGGSSSGGSSGGSSSGGSTRVSVELPTFSPDDEDDNEIDSSTTESSRKRKYTQIDLSAINKQLEETIRVARQVKEAEAAAQAVASIQQQVQQTQQQPKVEESIQLSFNNEISPSLANSNENNNKGPFNNELSESKSPAIDELSLDSNEDTVDLDDRNKRFLSFGGAGLTGGASGGAGGGAAGGAGGAGSGNFLFDIVRLFTGSVQTQAGDEASNSANSVSGSTSDSDPDSEANRTADGYTEGIPGPVTRLVVLANRGLANLVQDLILRIAATSEKFVNFKAKLITALI